MDDMIYIKINREIMDNLAEEILHRKKRKSMNQAREFLSIDGENEWKKMMEAKKGNPKAIEYLKLKYSLKIYTQEEIEKWKGGKNK